MSEEFINVEDWRDVLNPEFMAGFYEEKIRQLEEFGAENLTPSVVATIRCKATIAKNKYIAYLLRPN